MPYRPVGIKPKAMRRLASSRFCRRRNGKERRAQAHYVLAIFESDQEVAVQAAAEPVSPGSAKDGEKLQ